VKLFRVEAPKTVQFSGVFAAAVTPHRLEGHEADIGDTLELVDFLARSGVNGTVMLGSTGEFVHIKPSERARLVQFAVKRSRVPVIAGVSHSTLDGALELGSEAITSGAAALLLMPPHFFRYDAADLAEFYRRYAVEIGRSDVPMLLYNIPQFTSPIPFEVARDLIDSGKYAGIKDSSGDWDYFQQLAEFRKQREFVLFVGNDSIYPQARLAGADGVVSGCASAIPEVLVKLDAAIVAGDAARAEMLTGLLNEFIGWTNRFPTPVAVKVATAARGLKVGPLAVPLGPEKCHALDQFQSWFRAWFPSAVKA
jgi:dihydrodipicolinate synthase/N-acetylneuraminate lyase